MLLMPKKLAVLISSLYLIQPFSQASESKPNSESNPNELAPVVVVGERDADDEKESKVYTDNVSNLYLGPKELEKIQASNPADVLKGMNGVYSMDPRNGVAITPNIRGIAGQGRVPLTVDGTEQSTDVWLQMYGAGNRNYVDPAMFRSVSVEKGPSLSRDAKTGVGGSINIRTIEAGDILRPGQNLGAEIRLETAGNSVKPQVDAHSYFGKDYRDIPGAQLGMDNNVNVPQPVPRDKGSSSILNFDDHSEMITIAARNEMADVLLSYSQRQKGNYFAGTRGSGGYTHNDAYANDTKAYVPNLTKAYRAGNEVLNTASDSNTLLLKNNWYLPQDNKLTLSFMRSDLQYAETGVGQAIAMLGFSEALAQQGKNYQLVGEFPHSKLKLDTYKLSHEWKPEGSPWINLQSNLWMTKTDGERHQSGGGVYYIPQSQALKDFGPLMADWTACRSVLNNTWPSDKPLPSGGGLHECVLNPTLRSETKPATPEHDGKIYAGSAQWTKHDRKGFDVSNVSQIASNLRLTLGASHQQEKLNERIAEVKMTGGIFMGGAMLQYGTEHYGPRSGERSESTGMFNVEWEPTSWLTLTAGARYNRYKAIDTGLAERRRQKIASAEAAKRKAGLRLKYGEIMTGAEYKKLLELGDAVFTAIGNLNWDDPQTMVNLTNENFDLAQYPEVYAAERAIAAYAAQHNAKPYKNSILGWQNNFGDYHLYGGWEKPRDPLSRAVYWNKEITIPYVNGKLDAAKSPFAKAPINLDTLVHSEYHLDNGPGPGGDPGLRRQFLDGNPEIVYEKLPAAQAWDAPPQQKGDAFSPVISATVRFTPHSHAFVRHAQMTRFPSVFEIASSSVNQDGVGTLITEGASKPERSINWEVGYAHDLRQFMPSLYAADVRLGYFNTVIKDFIDREPSMNIIQFDEKKTSGLEFQSRFDAGYAFGNLGATYRLKQEICDENYAYGKDPFHNRMPKCAMGGFPGMLTATSLQPKYSINLDLGTRLFGNRLEMGVRSVYHAKAENPQLQALLSTEQGQQLWRARDGMHQMYWQSALLHDFYAQFSVNQDLDLSLKINNLTDRYYMDPMSKIPVPGPGRTLSVAMRARF